MPSSRIPLTLVALLLAGVDALAQHCGGPCEVPRPAAPAVSPNPRFTLTEGEEKADWRYLHNYVWTEDGEPLYRLEETLSSPPLIFAQRRIFLSPAGNGFLVTGNPYLESGRTAADPSLFVFCRRDGEPLVRVSLRAALSDEELVPGPCPAGCGCEDVLYVFERDPVLSANEAFVEVVAAGTGRVLSVFLPLGAPVEDRQAFELRLAALDWARVPAVERDQRGAEIDALVAALDHADAGVRAEAEDGLVAAGYLALSALRSRGDEEPSEERTRRGRDLEARLRPWADVGYERMAIDLDLLTGLLADPEAPVVAAARSRLAEVLPEVEGQDWRAWIEERRGRLRWDPTQGRYLLEPRRP